jgi:very-short-patch-repair endonuclease
MLCKFCSKEMKNSNSLKNHESRCPNNINRKLHPISKEARDKLSKLQTENNRSKAVKHKISKSMKLAHSEGRAWNIGKSRWNNKPSYPELFFMKVIDNEFNDKKYIREYPFHKYSLDFAWEHKKLCIEIDGDQHQRFISYSNRDKIKDSKLELEGWKVLRISWKDMYANPKFWINKAKSFIDIIPYDQASERAELLTRDCGERYPGREPILRCNMKIKYIGFDGIEWNECNHFYWWNWLDKKYRYFGYLEFKYDTIIHRSFGLYFTNVSWNFN